MIAPTLDKQVLDLVGDVMGLLDLEELCQAMIVALRIAVPSEMTALNELPADLPRTISISEPPVPAAFHASFARLAWQNPIAGHFLRTRDGRATRFSDLITPGELHRLELYREVYAPLGIEHQMAFMLPSPRGRVVGVALSRSREDFADRERDLINLARPYLIQAYRNALTFTLPAPADELRGLQRHLRRVGLTPRQAEVVADQDAAEVLGVSPRTVHKHLENCYRTLGVNNRSAAARRAWELAR